MDFIFDDHSMAYYIQVQEIVLAVQLKHYDFFHSNKTIITDYVELSDGTRNGLKFKNGLPQYIIDDILSEFDK